MRRLDYVSEVDVSTEGSVVHVSFRGGKAEQEEMESTIRKAAYDILRSPTEKGNGRSTGLPGARLSYYFGGSHEDPETGVAVPGAAEMTGS